MIIRFFVKELHVERSWFCSQHELYWVVAMLVNFLLD